MTKIKTYGQFINESNKIETKNEAFTISVDQLPSVGDMVDKIDWTEGEKIAFIDFKGVKNIPVQIVNNSNETQPDAEVELVETEVVQ